MSEVCRRHKDKLLPFSRAEGEAFGEHTATVVQFSRAEGEAFGEHSATVVQFSRAEGEALGEHTATVVQFSRWWLQMNRRLHETPQSTAHRLWRSGEPNDSPNTPELTRGASRSKSQQVAASSRLIFGFVSFQQCTISHRSSKSFFFFF